MGIATPWHAASSRSARIRTRAFTVLAVLVVWGLRATPAEAQWRLYVQAFERSTGAIVTDLAVPEVIVREDGFALPVVDVRPANLPTKLVVLVDNSRTAARAFDRIRDGLRTFFGRMPNQEVSLLALSPRPRWLVQGAIGQEEIEAGLRRMELGGRSMRLIDGLAEAGDWIAEDDGPHRPVIVLVASSGRDRSDDRNERFLDTVERLLRQGVTAHTLLMLPPAPGSLQRRLSVAEAVGRDLEEFTGGSQATIFLGSRLDDPLSDIATRIGRRNRELSRQHIVRFERPNDLPPGRIQVDVLRLGLRYVVSADGKLAE
ncbi:MAG: VWA domain-containing protein [Acidobacteria bacterium]|nr:VWA domain-containing protein [Acidobacteriota bacterium]MCY4637732.1 VWA domain-containing protein [Acidobacteriota bacterium]